MLVGAGPVDDKPPDIHRLQQAFKILEPHLIWLVSNILNESFLWLVDFQTFAGLCCKARKCRDGKYERRPGAEQRKKVKEACLKMYAFDYALDLNTSGPCNKEVSSPELLLPLWMDRDIAIEVLDVFAALLLRWADMVGMSANTHFRLSAKTLFQSYEFQKTKINEWSPFLDTGSLVNWQLLGRSLFMEEIKTQHGWARQFLTHNPFPYFKEAIQWPIWLANLAAGVTLVAAGSTHDALGFVPENQFTDHRLRAQLATVGPLHWPYGRSANACRKEKISALIYAPNWPSTSTEQEVGCEQKPIPDVPTDAIAA